MKEFLFRCCQYKSDRYDAHLEMVFFVVPLGLRRRDEFPSAILNLANDQTLVGKLFIMQQQGASHALSFTRNGDHFPTNAAGAMRVVASLAHFLRMFESHVALIQLHHGKIEAALGTNESLFPRFHNAFSTPFR